MADIRKHDRHARSRWMGQVEVFAVAINPACAGKLDWHTATYLFNLGKSVEEAAERLAAIGPVEVARG